MEIMHTHKIVACKPYMESSNPTEVEKIRNFKKKLLHPSFELSVTEVSWLSRNFCREKKITLSSVPTCSLYNKRPLGPRSFLVYGNYVSKIWRGSY